MGRQLGDEAAASRDPDDQALVGQALHRVACGHPADPELLAQRRVRRQRVARLQVVDPLAQRALDPAPSGDDGCGTHDDAAPAAAAARSAPWTAAPIAPAQIPSSAGTSSTASSDVVRTRRQLVADRREQEVARRGHAAADDDPIR